MQDAIPVVDVFAGPGGLGEGFSALKGGAFKIVLSAEMEKSAHQTLLLRAYFRNLRSLANRIKYYYPFLKDWSKGIVESDLEAHDVALEALEAARAEALNLELGKPTDDQKLSELVREAAKKDDRWVLIGGPPCQAYSVAGRARNKGNDAYVFEKDKRSLLYKHYLKLIGEFGPAVFVMENVKGLLSAKINGKSMFGQIVSDLGSLKHDGIGYELYSLTHGHVDHVTSPDKFIVKCEDHGVPQARHRVVILGIRKDILNGQEPGRLGTRNSVTLAAAHTGLPSLRSNISRSRELKSTEAWAAAVNEQYQVAAKACRDAGMAKVAEALEGLKTPAIGSKWESQSTKPTFPPAELVSRAMKAGLPEELARWLLDSNLDTVFNHSARSHMKDDFGRYAFAAAFQKVHDRSPKSRDFPKGLAPNHRNWEDGSFADRFFVQPPNGPCSTVTSHIAKDGHHFIHWDPLQCRAFSVREAARAQTFPDNYVFLGNRTQQYVQVGNAVPPFIALQIAKIVQKLLS